MKDFKERLEQCFMTAFPKLPREEICQASSSTVAEWDSLATVTLISLVEEEFNIAVSVDDIADDNMEQFFSFQRILSYLCSKQKGVDSQQPEEHRTGA